MRPTDERPMNSYFNYQGNPSAHDLTKASWWDEHIPADRKRAFRLEDKHNPGYGTVLFIEDDHPHSLDDCELIATRPTQKIHAPINLEIFTVGEGKPESSGGSCDYYKADVYSVELDTVQSVECKDVMHSLGLNHAEINMFKEIWRGAAARQGKKKEGSTPLRGAQKIKFFADENHALVSKGF